MNRNSTRLFQKMRNLKSEQKEWDNLLSQGADINAKDESGRTLIRALINDEANLTGGNLFKKTRLCVKFAKRFLFLLQNGAVCTHEDRSLLIQFFNQMPSILPDEAGNALAIILNSDGEISEFNGTSWTALLRVHPEFAVKCDWNKLNEEDWNSLLHVHPNFTVHLIPVALDQGC